MPVDPITVAAAGKVMQDVAGKVMPDEKCVRLLNQTEKPLTFECTFHSTTVDPGEYEDVDWAYGLVGAADVTIHVNGKGKLAKAGQCITVKANGNICVDRGTHN